MRRVIKRVIKTEVTEIWTISWINEPQPTQADSASSEALQGPQKSQVSSSCDVDLLHQSNITDDYD